MSYCSKCGSKQVKKLDGGYSTRTGKPTYRMVCPKEPCDHGCHDTNLDKFNFIRSFIMCQSWCRRCKKWVGVGE